MKKLYKIKLPKMKINEWNELIINYSWNIWRWNRNRIRIYPNYLNHLSNFYFVDLQKFCRVSFMKSKSLYKIMINRGIIKGWNNVIIFKTRNNNSVQIIPDYKTYLIFRSTINEDSYYYDTLYYYGRLHV